MKKIKCIDVMYAKNTNTDIPTEMFETKEELINKFGELTTKEDEDVDLYLYDNTCVGFVEAAKECSVSFITVLDSLDTFKIIE